jgi:hypothetical protein
MAVAPDGRLRQLYVMVPTCTPPKLEFGLYRLPDCAAFRNTEFKGTMEMAANAADDLRKFRLFMFTMFKYRFYKKTGTKTCTFS